MSSAPEVTVTPQDCMQDEPVTVKATGLKPGECYTLGSSATDSKGVNFISLANYRFDSSASLFLH